MKPSNDDPSAPWHHTTALNDAATRLRLGIVRLEASGICAVKSASITAAGDWRLTTKLSRRKPARADGRLERVVRRQPTKEPK
jgi:hypothetical protein